jgi:asparagine synthetase B (glutamine-hydrolysing)
MRGGEVLRVSSAGLERLQGMPLPLYTPTKAREREAVEEVSRRIDAAVGARGADHARVCVALSGGLDSHVVASALAERSPVFTSLTACIGTDANDQTVALVEPVRSAFPQMKWRPVLIEESSPMRESGALADDVPVCAPVMEPARRRVFEAARDLGFDCVLDGEGGDEVFDLGWTLGDLKRQHAWRSLAHALLFRDSRARLARSLLFDGTFGFFSHEALDRLRKGLPDRLPWLTSRFWASDAFAAAWEEAIDLARVWRPAERMRDVLGFFGRHWRGQELLRQVAGIAGASPLLDRSIVEYVGLLPASLVVDARHSKVLLRRVAALRAPAQITFRPKREPLYERLVRHACSDPAILARARGAVASSALLSEYVDVSRAMEIRLPNLAFGYQESVSALYAIVEWVAAIEARYLVS